MTRDGTDLVSTVGGVEVGRFDISDFLVGVDDVLQETVENIVGNYETETLDLLDRITVRPDFDHRDAINTLIKALKDAGIWAKLDGLYVLAAHTQQAALLNWKADARNLTAYNSPVFTTDRGIAGDGAASYLRTGSFSGSGLQMQQGSESLGLWIRTNAVEANAISVSLSTNDTGSSTIRYFNPRNGTTNVAWKMNFATTQTSPPYGSGDNMLIGLSTSGTDHALYHDGALDDTHSQATTNDPQTQTFYLVVGRTGSTYSTRQHSAVFYGAGLSAGEQALLHSALRNYMLALGAA